MTVKGDSYMVVLPDAVPFLTETLEDDEQVNKHFHVKALIGLLFVSNQVTQCTYKFVLNKVFVAARKRNTKRKKTFFCTLATHLP